MRQFAVEGVAEDDLEGQIAAIEAVYAQNRQEQVQNNVARGAGGQRRHDMLDNMKDFARNMMVSSDKTCCICLEDFKDSDEVVTLPCNSNHIFHYNCLDELLEYKAQLNEAPVCPYCR